ncbi:MAG: hypothetical protein R6U46_01720 [Marinilabilia sp.]
MKIKMLPLDQDLQKAKESLTGFEDISRRVLNYLPNVISSVERKGNYDVLTSQIAGTTKYLRPINRTLFFYDVDDFCQSFLDFREVLVKIRSKDLLSEEEKNIIDRTVYTIQQSIGAGLDLLVNPNSARKHVGNRFEELIKCIFSSIGISNKRIVLQIPYDTDEGGKTYKCENDLILSPYNEVRSTSTTLDEAELVVSAKTTSKDRMGKIFIDKMLLERFVGHCQRVVGIFLNDVQRKDANNISYTLVSGLFMVYSNFLTQLDGIYYLDPPPNALIKPYSDHMKRFSELISVDIKKLLSS